MDADFSNLTDETTWPACAIRVYLYDSESIDERWKKIEGVGWIRTEGCDLPGQSEIPDGIMDVVLNLIETFGANETVMSRNEEEIAVFDFKPMPENYRQQFIKDGKFDNDLMEEVVMRRVREIDPGIPMGLRLEVSLRNPDHREKEREAYPHIKQGPEYELYEK